MRKSKPEPLIAVFYKRPGLLVKLVEVDGMDLQRVEAEARTIDVCKAAIKNTFKAFEFVPKDLQYSVLIEVLTESPDYASQVTSFGPRSSLFQAAPEELKELLSDRHEFPSGAIQTNKPKPVKSLLALQISGDKEAYKLALAEMPPITRSKGNAPTKTGRHYSPTNTDKVNHHYTHLQLVSPGAQTMEMCVAAFTAERVPLDHVQPHICRKELLLQLLEVSPNTVYLRPHSMLTLEFICNVPDDVALHLLRRRYRE